MVAYSFKYRFVNPILSGLGDPIQRHREWPKRQTIRAHRRGRGRHARPGDELQLYCGLRTPICFLIGRARCVAVENVTLWFSGSDMAAAVAGKLLGPRQLKTFARADGFEDIRDMVGFWNEENDAPVKWQGVLIRWEPL